MEDYRIEEDSMGPVSVPSRALYGAQTQRALENFPISSLRMPRSFIKALGIIKSAAAEVNAGLALLQDEIARAITRAADEIADGKWDDQFPNRYFSDGFCNLDEYERQRSDRQQGFANTRMRARIAEGASKRPRKPLPVL